MNAKPSEHILIAEDSATQALQLQHLLTRHGYRVTAARNGREALVTLGSEVPALVITDINMPEMDGYELCRRIKDDAKLRDLPVILLTSLSDPKDILHGIECGADNFVVKPYDEDFLLSRIQFVLANFELRRQSGSGTEIFFAGQKYHLSPGRIRNLDLLLSTYETAVQKNNELSRAKEAIQRQADELREKNEQMEADLDMARELQMAFLPRSYPSFPPGANGDSALQFCHRYHATTELGGDFFDIFAVSDTEAGVFICDVMGHGVRAALVTALLRGLVEECKPLAADPGRFITQINSLLCAMLKETPSPIFASAFYVVIDVARGELRHATAGHPPPLLMRGDDGVEQVALPAGKAGPAMGVFADARFETVRTSVAAGDRILLFTDGLIEVEAADGSFYDLPRFVAALRQRISLPTEELCDELMAAVRSFSANQSFDDDVCLVGVDIARLIR